MRRLKRILLLVAGGVIISSYTSQALAQEKILLEKPILEQSVLVEQAFPIYELTQKQRDFIKKSKVNEDIWEYSDLFFENAENIREGKLDGSPLEDIIKIMNKERILPQQWDIKKWSLEYDLSKDEIVDAFAIYGLGIIDGKPIYVPTKKGLRALKESGLVASIDKLWKRWFPEELKEELRVKRQSGQICSELDECIYPLKYFLTTSHRTIHKYTSKNKEIDFETMLGTVILYVDARLFDEIPQEHKLVKQPPYIELEARNNSFSSTQ